MTVFSVMAASSILFGAPMNALISVIDPVLAMRIYPRARYGQFCSANAMLRSLGSILAGTLVGVYVDVIKAYFGETMAYRCLPFWTLAAACLTLFSVTKLYQSWKRLGGDEAYVPPGPTVILSGT